MDTMPARDSSPMAKFMASVTEETFQVLMGEARSRGITIQELLRAVIIPDWVRGMRMASVIPAGPIEPDGFMRRREQRAPF